MVGSGDVATVERARARGLSPTSFCVLGLTRNRPHAPCRISEAKLGYKFPRLMVPARFMFLLSCVSFVLAPPPTTRVLMQTSPWT